MATRWVIFLQTSTELLIWALYTYSWSQQIGGAGCQSYTQFYSDDNVMFMQAKHKVHVIRLALMMTRLGAFL